MSFIGKDDTLENDPEYVKRKREAYSQLIKEHPGERFPNQAGDLSGIDPSTGEDYRETLKAIEDAKGLEVRKKTRETNNP